MRRQRFNYENDDLNEYERSGFHHKNGLNHIDTKRLIKLGYKDKFPEALFSKTRNTHYFVPKCKTRYEYAINRLLDTISRLSKDWNLDYQDAIAGIKTPEEVQDEEYLNNISGSICCDDYEDADFNSLMEGIKRSYKYEDVVKSIHFQYIQKMFIDFFRSIMLVLKEKGHVIGENFDFKELREYAQDQLKISKDINPLVSLPHYKYFDLLRCINNFLKHNSVQAYKNLADSNDKYINDEHKKFLSSYVLQEEEIGRKYESGMYAGNWLKITSNYINDTLDNIREFSKEFCFLLYKEDAEEASWNYDDYLIKRLKKAMIEL